MSNIKKRQHYVWRHYLEAWMDIGGIWTYFKELDKIEKPKLMGVAQENQFYKLIDITNEEEMFLKQFINEISPEYLKPLNFLFLELFTKHFKLKKQLEENSDSQMERDRISEEIREREINLMEDAHGIMEDYGNKLLQCRNLDDLKSLNQGDGILDAIMFLCFQYSRTKNMRKTALQAFKNDKYYKLIEKSWNIISFVMATTLANSISLNKNIKFLFIENNTNNHFITGDQPVFNILNDKLNEKGEVIEIELYYPITPKHAIKIHFSQDQIKQFTSMLADNKTIDCFNKKVIENSDFFVFADSKAQLEKELRGDGGT